MYNGYNFYFKIGEDVLTFPITPGDLTITNGSNNKVVTLINEGDINILKSPSLTEVTFDARFPMRKYPYAREFADFESYWDKFKELKEKKQSFRFIVARTTPNGSRTWDTNLLMSLEEVSIKEDADEGDDVILTFNLKQYKEYGVVILKDPNDLSQYTSQKRVKKELPISRVVQTYTVKSGDTLWAIAQKYYGNGSKYTVIYDANKTIIENTAKEHGKASSSGGRWIFPGTKLTIPKL